MSLFISLARPCPPYGQPLCARPTSEGVCGLGSRIEGLGFGVSGKGSRVNLGLLRQAFEGLQGLCRVVLGYMIWVVVKIIFGIPIIIGHLILRVPKEGTIILRSTHIWVCKGLYKV